MGILLGNLEILRKRGSVRMPLVDCRCLSRIVLPVQANLKVKAEDIFSLYFKGPPFSRANWA